MNFRNLFSKSPKGAATPSWNGSTSASSKLNDQATGEMCADSNVVTFPLTPGYYDANGSLTEPLPNKTLTPSQAKHSSMIETPELVAYFREKYFTYGYHTGVRFRSAEALELGRQEHIAMFQNIIVRLIQRKTTKIARLQHELIGIEAISAVTSAQLKRACLHLEQEITALTEQHTLSGEGKGWVRQALVPYEAGFAKGVRTAIDFDVLAG